MNGLTAIRLGWTIVNGVSALPFLYLLVDSLRTARAVWGIVPPETPLRERAGAEAWIDAYSFLTTAGFAVFGVLLLAIPTNQPSQPVTVAGVYFAVLLITKALALLTFGYWRWARRRAQYHRIRRTAKWAKQP